MDMVDKLNSSGIIDFMLALVSLTKGDIIEATESAGPWGPWPFP